MVHGGAVKMSTGSLDLHMRGIVTCLCGHKTEIAIPREIGTPLRCVCGRTNEVREVAGKHELRCGEVPPATIDTANVWGVSAQGDRIALRFPRRTWDMSEDEALTLAAWLVHLVGRDTRFEAIRDAVRDL